MAEWIELISSPLGIMMLLILGGLLLGCPVRTRKTGRRLLLGGVALLLLYFFSPLAALLMFNLEKDYPPLLRPPETPRINKILILSGYAQERPGFPVTTALTDRTIGNLVEGLRLYRLLPDATLIISGGVRNGDNKSVAASMGDFLVQMGVAAERIQLEEKSLDTYENFVESRHFTGPEPFILVTQACDMRRAMAVARKLGLHPVPAPASFWALQYHQGSNFRQWMGEIIPALTHPSPENLYRLQWAWHEYLGYLWYRLRGRV